MRQFARILSPALTDVRLEWTGVRATPVPEVFPPFFATEPVRAYAWLDELVAGRVTLHAKSTTGPLTWSLDIDPQAVTSGRLVGTLAARARIRELEEGGQWTPSRGSRQRERRDERVVGAIVQLAMRYGLASRETSWVVVEKREVATGEPAVLRRVPIAIARGWGGVHDGAAGSLSMSRLDQVMTAAFSLDSPQMRTPMPRASRLSVSSAMSQLVEGWRESVSKPSFSDAPRGSERVFDRVVALQRADGSWELDEALLIACDLAPEKMPEVEASVPTGSPVEAKRAIATAIALTFLRRRALADQAEWAMLARKADRYLSRVAVMPNGGGNWLDAARCVL